MQSSQVRFSFSRSKMSCFDKIWGQIWERWRSREVEHRTFGWFESRRIFTKEMFGWKLWALFVKLLCASSIFCCTDGFIAKSHPSQRKCWLHTRFTYGCEEMISVFGIFHPQKHMRCVTCLEKLCALLFFWPLTGEVIFHRISSTNFLTLCNPAIYLFSDGASVPWYASA